MKHRILGALVAVALVVTAAAPASAANKEHQQLMADIRMLQEQSQILQNLLASLTEVVKTLSVHLDDRFDRTGTSLTKGFADQKLILDTLANDARVIRERLDDNNVRIGSLTQEVEALRGALSRPAPTVTDADPTGGEGAAGCGLGTTVDGTARAVMQQ